MDLSSFPTIDAYIAAQKAAGGAAPAPATGDNTTGNLFTSALKSGVYSGVSGFAGAVAAGAKAVGYDTGAANAQANAADYAQQAQQAGRSDIENQGFFGNGVGGFAKKTAYEVTKSLPLLGAGIAAAPIAPEIAEGGLLARVGGAIGSKVGSSEAGGVVARGILGGAAVTVPQAIGANYEAASAQPGGATQGDALKAIALGLPVGAAQAVVPGGLLGGKVGGSIGQRLANSALGNAAAGAVGSGLGTAATLSFDPTKTAGDKASEIVNAAVQGGALGGLFGGAFGLLGGHGPADAPARATNADLASTVDAATGQGTGAGAGVGASSPATNPRAPIEAQTLPQGPGAATGGGLAPLPGQPALPESGLVGRLLADRFGGQPQAPDQTALLDRFLGQPPEPGEVQGPAPLLALPKPLLRLTDQREAPEVSPAPSGPDIPLPDRSGSTPFENALARYDAIRLPDRSDLTPDQGAFVPEQRTLPVDTQGQYIKRLEDIRQARGEQPATGRDVVPYLSPNVDPANAPLDRGVQAVRDLPPDAYRDILAGRTPDNRALPWWMTSQDERVNASPTLGPEDAPNPHTQAPLDIDPKTGEVRRFSPAELYDPAIGAPRGDAPLGRLSDADDAAALERDRARLQSLFPDRVAPDADPARAAAALDPARSTDPAPARDTTDQPGIDYSDAGKLARDRARLQSLFPDRPVPEAPPRSIAERVTDTAHDLTGGTGGEASIAEIRKALPDLAPADIDNALRQIHADDGPNELSKAPAGQRAGVDGVSVEGQGRFHNLSVEASTDARVQERGAAPEAARDQPGSSPADGGGDPAGSGATGASGEAAAAQGRQGATDVLPRAEPTSAVGAVGERERVANVATSAIRDAGGMASIEKVRAALSDVPRSRQDTHLRDLVASGRLNIQRDDDNAGLNRRNTARRDAAVNIAGEDRHFVMAGTPASRAVERATDAAKDESSANAVLQPAGPDLVKPKATWGERQGTTALPRDEVQRHFDDVTKGIKAQYASKIHLVDNEDGLPLAVRRQAALQGLDLDNVPGMYHRGEVYIRADQVRSRADVEDVVSHEVFGHLANETRVGELYGPNGTKGNFEASMADAFDRAGGIDGIEKIARELHVWDGDGRGGAGVGLRGYLPDDLSNLSTHQKSVLLDELIAHAASATEIGSKQAALLTYVGKIKGVIADALRAAGLHDFAAKFDRFDANDVMKWVSDSREALSETPPKDAIDLASLGDDRLRFIGGGPSRDLIKPKLIRAQVDEAGGLLNVSGKLSDHLDAETIKIRAEHATTVLDGIRSGYGIVRKYGIGAMKDHYASMQARSTIEARVGQVHSSVQGPIGDFIRRYKDAGVIFNTLRQEATALGLDPKKAWEDHTQHLTDPRKDLLQARHAELARMYDKLGQEIGTGRDKAPAGLGQRLYDQSEALMRGDNFARMAAKLHNDVDLFAPGEKLTGFEGNLGRDFANENAAHVDPAAYERFMKGQLDQRMAGLQEHLMKSGLDDPANGDLRDLRDGIKAEQTRMDESPYWNLGRHGDYFLSAHIANDENGPVQASVDAISAALDKANMGDVALSTLNDNAHLFLRVGSRAELAALRKAIGTVEDHLDPTKDIRQGDVNSGKGVDGSADFDMRDAPALEKQLAKAKAAYGDTNDPAQQRALAEHINMVRSTWLDNLPNLALSKVLQQRKTVQGYSTQQLRNDVFRSQVQARAFAGMSMMRDTLDAAAGMQKAVRDAQLSSNTRETLRVRDGVNAYMQRSAASQVRVANSFADTVSKFVHSFYIGLSPSYFIMQLSQLGTLTLPELGSRYGYAKSTAALTRTMPAVARLMSEIVKQTGVSGADITPEVIAKAGLTKTQGDFLQSLVNGGHVNLSTFGRMGQIEAVDRSAIGAAAHKALKFSAGTATLAETAGRLAAALASHDLYTGDPSKAGSHANATDYAGHVLSESMFNWGGYDTPKLFTAGGPLGAAGPLAFQFHQFATKLFEKVTHEAYNGFVARGEDAATSRSFIYGHAAVVTALAGALGLPAAGWMAAAVNRLTGVFNDGEGYDVEAHARSWLASVVGKDAERILSNGIPRYLGADMSDLGDKSFLPFQRLLEDHRSFKDAVTSYLASSWGSTPGVAVNAVTALNDIKNGKLQEGLARILPAAILRNAAKAYSLSDRGYVNAKGERMPLSVSATDIIARAVGYDPGKQADERDREETVNNAKEDRKLHAGIIKQQLAVAIERHDQAGVAKWLDAARAYDTDPAHRGQPLLPSFNGYLATRASAMAYARATGAPLGTTAKDLPALNLANY